MATATIHSLDVMWLACSTVVAMHVLLRFEEGAFSVGDGHDAARMWVAILMILLGPVTLAAMAAAALRAFSRNRRH